MDEIILSDSEKEILEWMWNEDKGYSYKDISLQFAEKYRGFTKWCMNKAVKR